MEKEFKYATVWVRDGILIFTFKPVPDLTLRKAKILVASRLKFQKKETYPILCDIHNLKVITEKAADYLAREGTTMSPAIALLCYSHYHRLLAEIFIRFHNPSSPIRIFSNQEKAMNYLRGFL